MAKSIISNKTIPYRLGWKIVDPTYVQDLEADTTEVIDGLETGSFLWVDDGTNEYVAFVTGKDTFEDLPKVVQGQGS